MKKLLTRIMATVAGFAMAIGVGVANQQAKAVYADPTVSTLTFSAACGGSGTADDGVKWTVTSDGSESNFDNTKGIHYGTGSAEVGYIELSTDDIEGTVTKVVVNASTASGVSATVGVTIGGAAFGGDSKSLSSTATNYTFNGSASAGDIVVRIEKPSKATKAIYCKSIAVTYSSGESTKALSSIDLSGTYPTSFTQGDAFSYEGMTVTATYDDDSTADVTSSATFSGYNMNETGNQTVTVSYTEGNVTETTTYEITVNAPTYTVTYEDGGADSGTVPVDNNEYESGDLVTVLGNTGNLVKDGYTFSGWSNGSATYQANGSFNITEDTTLTAVWNETYDEGAETYDLSDMFDTGSWSSSYNKHSHEYNTLENETVTVTIEGASKQGNTITDVPVTKGSDVSLVLDSEARFIKNITFHARQWTNKAQTMTLHTSNDSGVTYTNTEITSNNFRIRGTDFAVGTNAIKVTFDSSANQVGCVDFVVTYDDIPTVEATSMTITPSSLSIYCAESGSFTPTLSGGQGNYEKTITWTSSEPSIIAAPADSEAGVQITVDPSTVNADTEVTLTGTVDVENGASSSIVITVKSIKTVSVASVSISGIANNSELDGENDNTIAINKKIQFSANVNYDVGPSYMEGSGDISWSASDADVATVDSNGLVTLKGNGSVEITATSDEDTNKSNSLTFSVSNINDELGSENNPYTVAQANDAIGELGQNQTIENAHVKGIISKIDDYLSSYHSITYWISDDGTTTDQLKVYSGKGLNGANFNSKDDIVVGASVIIKGSLKVYNDVKEFDKNNQQVSYTRPSATGITLSSESVSVEIGNTIQLTATLQPAGSEAEITWSTDDDSIASVDNAGLVTGIASGTTTITAKISDEITAECEVKVVTPIKSANQTIFTANLTSTASVDNSNLSITFEAEKKSGYYQDGSGSERYFLVSGESPLFAFEPGEIVFTAELGGGSIKDELDNNVEVCFVDSNDDEITSTKTTVTTSISSTTGSEYSVTIPYSENAYGIKLSHVKETGYNVRYYSFSLSYRSGTSRAVLSGNETNDGNTVTIDSVKMTFGASVPASVWNELGTIEDYGVMMYKTTKALNAISDTSVKERFRDGKALANFHKGSGEAAPDGDVYNFSAYVSFSDDTNYDVVVCAAPYIVINGTYYFFDEMHYSVNLLAQYHLANGGSNLSEEALNVLAGN